MRHGIVIIVFIPLRHLHVWDMYINLMKDKQTKSQDRERKRGERGGGEFAKPMNTEIAT